MNDFPCPQKLDDIVHIRIVTEPQNVVISDAGFLFRGQILCQIRNQVTFYGHGCGIPRESGGCCGINACGVIHKIRIKAALLDIVITEIPRQLVHDRANHLKMPQFLCAD